MKAVFHKNNQKRDLNLTSTYYKGIFLYRMAIKRYMMFQMKISKCGIDLRKDGLTMINNTNTLALFCCISLLMYSSFSKPAVSQMGPSTNGGDALWHLPKWGETGWFIHAHNGSVRVCNLDKVSVVGEKTGPKCSSWE